MQRFNTSAERDCDLEGLVLDLDATDAGRTVRQFLSFRIADDHYAVDILRVQEIRGWDRVRPLPETQEYLRGVLDLRGVIVPIIDLRLRFGAREPQYLPTTVVIVLAVTCPEGLSQPVGAVVDCVSDVLDLNPDQLRPLPQLGGSPKPRYLEAIASSSQGLVAVLNPDQLFDPDELDVPDGIAGAP